MSIIFNAEFNSETDLNDWTIHMGGLDRVSISGGVLTLGTDTDIYDGIFMVNNTLIPYKDLATYKSSISCRDVTTSGLGPRIYAGFVGIAADGETVVDVVGGTEFRYSHWHTIDAGRGIDGAGGWVLYEGYTFGFAPTGGVAPGDEAFPVPVQENVAYIKPCILANVGSLVSLLFRRGIKQFQYFKVEETNFVIGTSTGGSSYNLTASRTTIPIGNSASNDVRFTLTATNFTDGVVFLTIVPSVGSHFSYYNFNADNFETTLYITSGTGYKDIYVGAPYYPFIMAGTESFYVEARQGSWAGTLIETSPVITLQATAIPAVLTSSVYTLSTGAYILTFSLGERPFFIKDQPLSLIEGTHFPYVITGLAQYKIHAATLNGESIDPYSVINGFFVNTYTESLLVIETSLAGYAVPEIPGSINGPSTVLETDVFTLTLVDPPGGENLYLPSPVPSTSIVIADSGVYGFRTYDANGKVLFDLSYRASILITSGTVNLTIPSDTPTMQVAQVNISVNGMSDNGMWSGIIINPIAYVNQQVWCQIFNGYLAIYYRRDIFDEPAPATVSVNYAIFKV